MPFYRKREQYLSALLALVVVHLGVKAGDGSMLRLGKIALRYAIHAVSLPRVPRRVVGKMPADGRYLRVEAVAEPARVAHAHSGGAVRAGHHIPLGGQLHPAAAGADVEPALQPLGLAAALELRALLGLTLPRVLIDIAVDRRCDLLRGHPLKLLRGVDVHRPAVHPALAAVLRPARMGKVPALNAVGDQRRSAGLGKLARRGEHICGKPAPRAVALREQRDGLALLYAPEHAFYRARAGGRLAPRDGGEQLFYY